MKQFSRLALILSFMSVVVLPNDSAAAAQMDLDKEQRKIGKLMTTYFSTDTSTSPLSGRDSGSQLVKLVAGHMKAGNGKILHRLFYKPDANQWSTLYQEVKPSQAFSALNLVKFLDKTKTDLLNAYRGVKRIVDGEACLHVATLFDNAMQQIFEGCWGFSDAPTPTDDIKALKQIYGRLVSGLLPTMAGEPQNHLGQLEQQKNKSADARIQGHFAALQECFIAVLLSASNATSNANASLAETLSLVRYQDPLEGILHCSENVRMVAAHLLNPSSRLSSAARNLEKIEKITKYGFRMQTLTDEQITNLEQKLPKDEIYSYSEKLEILCHTISLPTITEKLFLGTLRSCELMILRATKKKHISAIINFLWDCDYGLNLPAHYRSIIAKLKEKADEKLRTIS
ncbi:hypothetical protein [Candidatus Finniella inopinata]|uniref:Uncharacterized protein n=1 Tax=Candidatus Finniella inopinata TaxID=1696036 RepID=A0A4Q7DIB4_9PROT|nr:hypothetical protein [Candidatus Finniella inopinata]RZI45919.1 hypothetical protein EQU50_05670 [Candidatus Finniella inopinata]